MNAEQVIMNDTPLRMKIGSRGADFDSTDQDFVERQSAFS
jgi:hypothetical protein